MILRHTLPPGHTCCQPQLAAPLSHSIRVVNIGHTPVPAVSASPRQPASNPPSDYHLMPPPPINWQGGITSSHQFLHCLLVTTPTLNRTEFRHVKVNQTQNDSERLLIFTIVCMCTKSRSYFSAYHVGVCELSSDARGWCWDFTAQHAASPPFAIQMSMYEASSKLKQPSSPLCLIGSNHSLHLQVNSTISY